MKPSDLQLLAGAVIALGSAWFIHRLVFFSLTMVLGLLVVYLSIYAGEEERK